MKLYLAVLLIFSFRLMSAQEIDWEAVRKAEAQNQNTVKELMTKAGVEKNGSNWSPKLLKKELVTWEYYFYSPNFDNTTTSPVVTPIAFAALPPLITTATQPFGVR